MQRAVALNIPLPPGTATEGYLYMINNTVLPILDEFKPEIIINSAGQDNHYTDPLTNMKFSAQGYAELTRLLKPDIAVLEGGYAIEGALPYVNLGIILALAGMDFSRVVEPDYNPENLMQALHVTQKIEQTSKVINRHWHQRMELREKAGVHGEIQQRHREIFYDTDSILERQKEKIRICRDCAGAFEIDSQASTGKHVLCVHIPLNACQQCREAGYEMFERADMKRFSQAFLQDRPNDTYVIK